MATHKCPACQGEMLKCKLQGHYTLKVYLESENFTFWQKVNPPSSEIQAYTCKKCGLINMYAKNPEKLDII